MIAILTKNRSHCIRFLQERGLSKSQNQYACIQRIDHINGQVFSDLIELHDAYQISNYPELKDKILCRIRKVAIEELKEHWYPFRRIYCKGGFIDYWMGDCANDPNNETKSNVNLNASASFVRINDGKWESTRLFQRNFIVQARSVPDTFSAIEIYESLKL